MLSNMPAPAAMPGALQDTFDRAQERIVTIFDDFVSEVRNASEPLPPEVDTIRTDLAENRLPLTRAIWLLLPVETRPEFQIFREDFIRRRTATNLAAKLPD